MLILLFYNSIKFNNTSYIKYYTISILLVYNIKLSSTILYLIDKEKKVYLLYIYKVKSIAIYSLTSKRLKLFKLFISK